MNCRKQPRQDDVSRSVVLVLLGFGACLTLALGLLSRYEPEGREFESLRARQKSSINTRLRAISASDPLLLSKTESAGNLPRQQNGVRRSVLSTGSPADRLTAIATPTIASEELPPTQAGQDLAQLRGSVRSRTSHNCLSIASPAVPASTRNSIRLLVPKMPQGWLPRNGKPTLHCANKKCNSPGWNRPRKAQRKRYLSLTGDDHARR